MPFCFLIHNFTEIWQSINELWPKKQYSRWRPQTSWILKISIFGQWLSWGLISAVVYQISSKSHDFSLRYGDLAVFKMAAVRHLGFVMTSQYLIAGHIFVVQILSWNFMSIGVVVSEILAISYVGLLAVRTTAILRLRMRCITWPLVGRSKMTTHMKFLTPICLFTMPLLGVYDDD